MDLAQWISISRNKIKITLRCIAIGVTLTFTGFVTRSQKSPSLLQTSVTVYDFITVFLHWLRNCQLLFITLFGLGLWLPAWFFLRLHNFLHFLRLEIANNFCFLKGSMQKPLQYIKFLKMFLSLALCYWSDRFPSSIAILYLFTRLNICKYLYWNVVLEKDGDQLERSREKWRSITNSQTEEEFPT